MKRYDEKEKRSLVRIGLFFALLAISIITEGYFSYRDYAVHFRTHVEEQLTSINKLKATELAEQLDEYLSDAEILRLNRDFAAHVGSYFEDPQNGEFRQIQAWLQNYQSNGEYENVVLLDIKGTVRISDNESIPPVSPEVKAYISKAVTTKQVEFVDFYKSETDQSARLAILIPIMNMQSEDQVSGLVLMVINPNIYLYPYIEQSPVPGKTGESVLIRREGDEFLLLNTPRLSADNPLTIRRKLTNATVLKTAIEQNGFAEGADYRGESVVAVVQAVAGSPWILVTKLDTIEAYAPVRGYLQQTIIVCIALISIIGTALALVWRGQRLRYYHQQFELAEALSQSEQNLRNFFNTIDHMLFVLDNHGGILLANDTVSRTLGYSIEELKGQNVLMLHPPERREEAGRIVGEMLAGATDYCPVPLCAKDGRHIPVETRAVKGQWSGQDVIFGVTKDISEIQASEEKFSKVFQSSPAPMAITDTNTGRYINVNEIFLQTLGFTREDVIDKTAGELNLFVDADQRVVLLERMKVQGYLRNEEVLVRAKSGDLHNGVFSAEYIKLQNQDLLLTVMNDITERKRTEEIARASELRFSAIFQASPVRISITRFKDSLFLDVNETFLKTSGYTREEIIGRTSLELSDWADPQERVRLRKALEGNSKVQNFETQILRKSGDIMDVLISAEIIELMGERCVLSVGLDISDRKQMEEALRKSEALLAEAQQIGHIGHWEWTAPGWNLNVSDEVLRIFEIPLHEGRVISQEVIGAMMLKEDFEYLHKLDRIIFKNHASDMDYEFRINLPSGKTRWIHQKAKIEYGEDGEPIRMMGTMQDVTGRKLAEEKYRNIFENSMDGIFQSTPEGKTIIANPAMARILGYDSPEDLIVSITDTAQQVYVDANIRAEHLRLLEESNGSLAGFEYQAKRKDGSTIWVSENARTIRDANGKPLYYEGMIEDISRRKLAEEALRASEANYRNLVETSESAISVINKDGKILYANSHANQLWNTTSLVGKSLFELYPREFAEQYLSAIEEIIRTQVGITAEAPETIKDRLMWFRVSIQPLQNTDGSTDSVVISMLDTTEKVESEILLKESEMRFRQLADNIQEVFWMYDREDDKHIYSNSAYQSIYGIQAEKIGIPSLVDITLPEDQPALIAALEDQKYGKSTEVKYRILHKDNSIHWIWDRSFPIYDEAGKLVRTAGVATDITENKKTEDDLRERESFLQSIVNSAPGIIVSYNLEGCLQYASQAKPQQSDAAFHNMKFLDLLHPDHTQPVLDAFQKAVTTWESQRLELLSLTQNDGYHWFDVTYSPQIVNGEVKGITSFSYDINERKQAEAALQKSEAVYRQAIEVSGAVPYLQAYTNIGEGIDYSFIGEGIRQITGYGPEEFNGKLWDSLVEEIVLLDDLAGYSIHEAIQRVRSGKNSIWKCEHRIRARNGETRWVFEAAVELRGANEISYGSIGLYQDITERKQTELALRNSEEKYRGLMESLDSVVATTDFEGRYLYMNDIAASQLGGKPDDFIGKTMHELLPALIADTQLKAIQQAFRQNKEMVDETISFVNGKPRWYRTMVQPIHNENGQVAYALINATDIHDLKTAQHDLQELNRTLEERVEQRAAEVQDLYDNAPNGYHSLDANGAFILINQTELNRLGYARRDIVGVKKFRDLLTPQSQLIFDRIFPEFKIEGTIADLTLELIRKDGSVFPVLLNASIMRDEHNKFLMSRSTTIDITERVKVENALLESRDELSAANAALEKAARMKDEFLASMSHELRTPLTGVLGLSEALQLKAYGDLNEKQLNTLKTIEESGRHLLDLINDILDLSKIEAGRLELQFGPTYMEDICQASLQLIKGMAQQKHQQIHYSPAAEVTIGYADARRIKQILVNLLSNAVKFTPNGGELGLEVEHSIPEQKLKFSVWDKGIGIKPEDMHKLFKPFTQIDSSLAREYNGTGLGLSLAHRLVELHNGGIEVESAPGKGSRFTVTLPWSPQDTTNMKIPEPRRQSAIQQTVDSAPPTILIADDNETVLELLTDFLEMKQYRVIKVRSGVELLAKITEVLPSLMLVDIQMPGMDGLETIRRIRSHSNPAIAATPVIAVTALAMPGDRDLCMSAGANEYMSKPLKLLELADIVEKWKRS